MERRRLALTWIVVCGLAAVLFVDAAEAGPLKLVLPTRNTALLHGDGPGFYMYTDRNFRGRKSYPWEGGQYGYVRSPKDTPFGVVNTRFHEGLDIQPVYRDEDGEPLDTVRAIDVGYVAYINDVSSYSNYGKYVVVEHWWSGAPFYSLYAHLGSVNVYPGQRVVQGQRLGRMGYTGKGINRRRAHLHFEINLLLNADYPIWHEANVRGSNHHGRYNGYNLAGLDVAALYLALQRDPDLTIDRFLASQAPLYKVAVPNRGALDLLERYPFLSTQLPSRVRREAAPAPPSWEIWFTASGLPVRVEPNHRRVFAPRVAAIEPSDIPYGYLTSGELTGSGSDIALSRTGKKYLDLITSPVGSHYGPTPDPLDDEESIAGDASEPNEDPTEDEPGTAPRNPIISEPGAHEEAPSSDEDEPAVRAEDPPVVDVRPEPREREERPASRRRARGW